MTATTTPATYTVTASWGELVDMGVSLDRAVELVAKYPGSRVYREHGDDFENAELVDLDAERAAARIAHLEEMLVRNDQVMADQAQLIRDQKAERDQLQARIAELDLELDRQIEEAGKLRTALERRNGQLATATDAAEAYRQERDAAEAALRNIAALAERPER